jgi:hypothetical protein
MDVSQVLWQRVRMIGHREPKVSLAAHISARSLPRTTEKETISPSQWRFCPQTTPLASSNKLSHTRRQDCELDVASLDCQSDALQTVCQKVAFTRRLLLSLAKSQHRQQSLCLSHSFHNTSQQVSVFRSVLHCLHLYCHTNITDSVLIVQTASFA